MSDLGALIASARAKVESEYTALSWAALDTALDAAVIVMNDRMKTVPQVDGAIAALTAAIEALVPLKVETPTADPAAGQVANGTAITLACATAGATIRFTTDGSDPIVTSTAYNAAAKPTVTGPVTIKAKAWKGAMDASDILEAAYTLNE